MGRKSACGGTRRWKTNFKKNNTMNTLWTAGAGSQLPSTVSSQANLAGHSGVEEESASSYNQPGSCARKGRRLDFDLYDAVDGTHAGTCPSYLRPMRMKSLVDQYTTPILKSAPRVPTVTGNRIVSMMEMSKFMNTVFRGHRSQFPECDGNFIFPATLEKIWGMATILTVKCVSCGFMSSPTKMFEEIQKSGRGRKGAKINMQLANAMSKMATSVMDIALLFSAMDLNVIAPSSLQRLVNDASPRWSDVNEIQLHKNREFVQTVAEHTSQPMLFVTDTSYNNPPKGRTCTQPGTQSFTPLIECLSKKQLTLAATAVNTHCTCDSQCNHTNCSKNYPANKPISQSEVYAGRKNLEACERDGILPDGICCDGTSLTVKGAQAVHARVEKLDCMVHVSRGQRRKVFSVNLALGGSTAKQKELKHLLCKDIPRRCTLELCRARQKFGQGQIFAEKLELVRKSIVNCLAGDHTECVNVSQVCKGPDEPAKWFHGNPLALTQASKAELQKVVDHKLSKDRVWRQRYGLNTNKAESLHNRVYHVTPKSKLYRRNYGHRASSAVHTDSVGVANSLLAFNEETKSSLQHGSTSIRRIKILQSRMEYFKTYQNGYMFRVRRREAKLKKLKLKQLKDMQPADGQQPAEHSYSKTKA